MQRDILRLTKHLALLYLRPLTTPYQFEAIKQELAVLRIINKSFASGTKHAYEAIALARATSQVRFPHPVS